MYGPLERESRKTLERRCAVLRTNPISRALRSLACIALASGLGPSLPAQARLHPVRIDNPERLDLVLEEVDDGTSARPTPRPLEGSRIDLLLPVGKKFWLAASTSAGAVALPIPVTARTILPERIDIRVGTPPPRDPDFAFVPAGPALLGDTLGVGQPDEHPARVVDVAAFWIARHEATNREYAAFLDALGADFDPDWIDLGSRKCRIRVDAGSGKHASERPDEPVVTVSHAGAVAYCAWKTRETGLVHRLPTAVEWEKAARGPRSSTYSYGDVYRRDAANQESGQLAAVGVSGAATGFGTFDMTGNAFEWTSDVYTAGTGTSQDGTTAYRELRGGSFVLDGMYLRNSFRMKLRPGVRADDVGFRVVREHVPATPPTRRREDHL
jgi:formylglycine-generating enzyme required for sulfatase activity